MNIHKLKKATAVQKRDALWKYSNPIIAQKRSYNYLGKKHGILYKSTRKNKKYMVVDKTGHEISFGQLLYEDYTKHRNTKRRSNYLRRSAKIKGNWKNNKFSANNLARNILW